MATTKLDVLNWKPGYGYRHDSPMQSVSMRGVSRQAITGAVRRANDNCTEHYYCTSSATKRDDGLWDGDLWMAEIR